MANRDLEKRLAAIEQVITGGVVELIFVPTRQLAARAERALAKLYAHRKFRLVCLPVDDVDGSVEAELREHNPRNSFAVMFQKTEQAEPLPENKSQALPAHTPMVAGAMPGGKPTAKGRYPKGMKTLPNPWHQPKRRKKGLGRLMGE